MGRRFSMPNPKVREQPCLACGHVFAARMLRREPFSRQPVAYEEHCEICTKLRQALTLQQEARAILQEVRTLAEERMKSEKK